MEVRQLQIFRTLAEELSFTRTAEKVHTVQSNVTAQIKALEEELGIPLFDRLGRRVTLTDAGRNFLPFALQALAAMDHGQRALQTGAEPAVRCASAPRRVCSPIACPRCCAFSAATFRMSNSSSVLTRIRRSRSNSKPESSTWRFMATICSPRRASSPSACARSESSCCPTPATRLRPSQGQTCRPGGTESAADGIGMQLPGKARPCARAGEHSPRQRDGFFPVLKRLKQCVALGMGLGLLPEIVVSSRTAPEPSQSAASGPGRRSTLPPTSSGTRTNGFLLPWPPSWSWSRTN